MAIKAAIYADRAAAEKAIAAIDAARHPDGTEVVTVLPGERSLRDPTVRARCTEITLPDGSVRLGYRETRPAKPWAEPIELEDGRHAVPWKDERLAELSGREVEVKGEQLRVPVAEDVKDLDDAVDAQGEPLTRDDKVLFREAVRLVDAEALPKGI